MDIQFPVVSIENDENEVYNLEESSKNKIDKEIDENCQNSSEYQIKDNQNLVENSKMKLFYSKLCPWIKWHDDKNNLEYNENCVKMENKDYCSNRIRTNDVKPNTDASFESFNIKPNLLMAMKEIEWYWPSPIQEATILKIINGKNVIARSKNGTGKTGAFLISVLNKIDTTKNVEAIILTTTRELALQISNVCFSLSKYLENMNIMVSTGGTSLTEDLFRLSGSINIIIGTPVRILDLLIHESVSFMDLKILIFDEADKLLSIDFQKCIENIIENVPVDCQKVLFSATYPLNLKSFINKYFENVEYCNVMNELTLAGITQYYAYLNESQKLSCLKVLIKNLEIQQSIIFCNSSKRVELLAKFITEAGYSCYYIHSKMMQEARNRVFHDFRCGFVTFLVCTDIIARGIDVSNVNVVFNFDFPRYSETYLHRIGRCGRFGSLGIAINLVTGNDRNRFKQFESEIDTKIHAIPISIDKRLYVYSCQTSDQFKNDNVS